MANYQNTHKIIDNYGYVILLKIRTSTVTSYTKFIKYQDPIIGFPPKLDTI